MLGVFVACVLDSEIINNQTEDNGTGRMGEKTMSMLCLDVLGEMLDALAGRIEMDKSDSYSCECFCIA
jgi:hypothetical protein